MSLHCEVGEEFTGFDFTHVRWILIVMKSHVVLDPADIRLFGSNAVVSVRRRCTCRPAIFAVVRAANEVCEARTCRLSSQQVEGSRRWRLIAIQG